MSQLYGPRHRELQDRFDTRRLADGVERRIVRREITPEHRAFIESRDMFWLATIDHQGRPTVSSAWKRIDDIQAELPAKDQGRAEGEGGLCSRQDYEKYLANVSCRV